MRNVGRYEKWSVEIVQMAINTFTFLGVGDAIFYYKLSPLHKLFGLQMQVFNFFNDER